MSVDIATDMRGEFVGDGARLGQILTNLVGNAIKFTSVGAISVSAESSSREKETQVEIKVTDSGQGIPDSQLGHVFEDYVVLSDAQGRLSRGDGLGLSIARKIALAMGGEISVSSTEGEGSTFVLSIPLVRSPQGQGGAVADRLPAVNNDQIAQAKKRVLIVEDNPINRSVLADMLGGLGHDVAEAEDGERGHELAAEHLFDLIIMDISMPGMDGIQTTVEIRRSQGPNRHTPIYGLTAYADEENRLYAETVGMSGFFTKPLRLESLRQMLRGSEPARPSIRSQESDFDSDVVAELLDALGAQAMLGKANAFFSEARTILATIDEADPVLFSKQLHRLSGAAALLGLVALAREVDMATDKSARDREMSVRAIIAELERAEDRLLQSIDSYAESQNEGEVDADLSSASARV